MSNFDARHGYAKLPDPATLARCNAILIQVAETHNVPPAFIIAHIRGHSVDAARKEVMKRMLGLGLKRCQVALMFRRDLRRVRASVIGGPIPDDGPSSLSQTLES